MKQKQQQPDEDFSAALFSQAMELDNTPAEFVILEKLLESSKPYAQHRVLANPVYQNEHYPQHALCFGSDREDVPVLFFVGGIHGIERIGAQVVLAFLDNFVQRLHWDKSIQFTLENLRLWFVPVANPVGLKFGLRSNGNRVDLMRNAPVDADGMVTPLLGGQRISRKLPWHRGLPKQMEAESDALSRLVLAESLRSPLTLLLDVHSGFGMHDRLWFPLACSHRPIEHLPEFYQLYRLLRHNYPNHSYLFEPQSRHYLTHGDLWDYCYLRACARQRLLMPLTLEMGSWRWLKKNPLQLSPFGVFNPIKPHRVQRTLRGHLMLMEFLIRASRSWQNWLPPTGERANSKDEALRLWYRNHG